jgi:hypothetical protein
MPRVSLKLMAGAARSMVVASARTTAAEIAARWCARKVRGEDRELGTREGFLSDRVWVDFRNDAQRGDLKKRQAPKGISLLEYFSRARMRNRHNGLDGKKYPFNCMIALRGH